MTTCFNLLDGVTLTCAQVRLPELCHGLAGADGAQQFSAHLP